MTYTEQLYKAVLNRLPAEWAVGLTFRRKHGFWPNFKRPTTFSEKVQYRKLYDRNHLFPRLADKIEAKTFVASTLGPQWIIPTLWSGETLPPRSERTWNLPFVIK